MQKARLHRAILENSRAVYKIAMVILRNPDDADDALQETFLQYFKKNPQFESAEQERVWLIRCAVNVSKNMRRTIFRHSHEPLREEMAAPAPGTLPDLLFSLPLKDRMILQLRYVENYSAEEIAQLLHLSVAAIAVLLFGLLLLWPKKPIEEQVVTLPGSSSAAKPGEYVENKPSKEEDSSNEQGTDKEDTAPEKEQSSEDQKDIDNEEKLPVAGGEKEEKEEDETNKSMIHRFWETEKEMPYEEAVAIVKEKLENRPHETLTDKERMAYYQCISTTVYAKYLFNHETYLKYLEEFHGKKKPYADPESPNYRTDNPWITIEFTTTKDGVGSDFQAKTPLNFSDEYVLFDLFSPKIKEITEDSYRKFIYTEYLNKEDGAFVEKDSYTVNSQELEYGNGYGSRSFNFKGINILKEKLSKKTIQEIVRYYLSFESVTWLNIEFEDIYYEVDTWV